MAANPIIWWELETHDQEKSVKFFEKVFGWEFRIDEKMTIKNSEVSKTSEFCVITRS